MSSAMLIVLLALSCFLHASIVIASIKSQTVIAGGGNIRPALADKDKEDGSVEQSTDCVKIPMTACSATCDKADEAYQSKGKLMMMTMMMILAIMLLMIMAMMMIMIMMIHWMMMMHGVMMIMTFRYPGMGEFVRRGPQVSISQCVCYH